MKTFLIATGSIFALLIVAHVQRLTVEPHLISDPFFLISSLLTVGFCVWAWWLFAQTRGSQTSTMQRHDFTEGLYGWITHTDLASNDPEATKAWCAQVLGWSFHQSFPTPDGLYHLFAYSEQGGGGIRRTNPPEMPAALPYVHVADAQAAYDKALAAGAESMIPPARVMEGVSIAVVRAPGGVPIGFSGR